MIKQVDNNLFIHILIQPKASRDKIVGLHGDEIKVAITAPPVDGQANQHLIKFLARQFKVAKSAVSLVKGQQSRHKLIQIESPKHIPSELRSFID